MFEKVKKAIKKRKEKKSKKEKPLVKPVVTHLVYLNEVQIVDLLKGLKVKFDSVCEEASVVVSYEKHPSATPQGLMQFWLDVIAAVEQKKYDQEDDHGVAVRSGPAVAAVAAAMRDQSFVPPALRQIAGQLQSQHETVEKVKALAETPEQADAAVKKLSVGEAIKQLENKHVEGKES